MFNVRLGAALVAGAMMIATAVAPASAASPITKAFKANVDANVGFLEQSARLAAQHSKSEKVLAYAREAEAEAARTAQAFEAVIPDDVAAASPADSTALMTGRSVAIDTPTHGVAQSANGRPPLGAKDIDALAKLSGRKFDDAFWLKQVDALSQLRADYQSYADDGDDAALAAMAQRELPKVEQRLAVLSKI